MDSRDTVFGEHMSDFVVITGLSGAGRSQTADHLEDLGWFVIDNVPAALVPKLAELVADPGSTHDRAALVVRSGDYEEEIRPALDALRATAAARARALPRRVDRCPRPSL